MVESPPIPRHGLSGFFERDVSGDGIVWSGCRGLGQSSMERMVSGLCRGISVVGLGGAGRDLYVGGISFDESLATVGGSVAGRIDLLYGTGFCGELGLVSAGIAVSMGRNFLFE